MSPKRSAPTATVPRWCSALLEYLGAALNGEWRRVPLPAGPLKSRADQHAAALRHGGDRIPHAGGESRGRDARHQGVPDAERGGDVQPAAVRTVLACADAVLHFPDHARPARRCCSDSSTAWRMPGTSRSRRRRELKDALDALTSNEFVDGRSSFLAAGAGRCREHR